MSPYLFEIYNYESYKGYIPVYVIVVLLLAGALYNYNANVQKKKELENRKRSFNKRCESLMSRRINSTTCLSKDQSDQLATNISQTIDSNPSDVAFVLLLTTLISNMRN